MNSSMDDLAEIMLQPTETKTCVMGCGDCSNLKQMLEEMKGFKRAPKKIKEEPFELKPITIQWNQSSSGDSVASPNVWSFIDPPSRKSDEPKKSPTPPARTGRSAKARTTPRSYSRSNASYRRRSRPKHRPLIRSPKLKARSPKPIKQENKTEQVHHRRIQIVEPPPTFMSICRCLITLEGHVPMFSSQIKNLFAQSLALEREEVYSSNKLLVPANIAVLEHLKHFLKDQVVSGFLPDKMFLVARTFVNEYDRLMNETNPIKVEKDVSPDKKNKLR